MNKTMPFDPVAHYYDQNTSRFLRLGGSGDLAAIHRQIWAPGVHNHSQAFLYLNQVVADAVAPVLSQVSGDSRLLDLGCGVGGTATWLAQTLGAKVTGVTNSAAQADLARQRAAHLDLAGQCQFHQADFHHLPAMGKFQAAYAIESFVHARDPKRFFEQAASTIMPGGRLVICDDFLAEAVLQTSDQALHWVQRFTEGWEINSLTTFQDIKMIAEKAGFRLVGAHNLSPYLRSFHPLVLSLMKEVTRIPFSWAYWKNLSGGTALQVCVQRGWTEYIAAIWELT
jgi:ubiquinone/menaquinone biosynthesis C-methylase UbiE